MQKVQYTYNNILKQDALDTTHPGIFCYNDMEV